MRIVKIIALILFVSACATSTIPQGTGQTLVSANVCIPNPGEPCIPFSMEWRDGKAGDVEITVYHPVTGQKIFHYKGLRSQPETVMLALAAAEIEIAKYRAELGKGVADSIIKGIATQLLGL